ncbi:isopentenyl-diphosphate Delta-isomerase [Nakamurella endophytica]|uniref:Isopentenyl-diphosphate Delta-isomerase n=1 Tax=Nakamurella endophytica TaxID=1748367 RepID=A0A917WL46_9ACTN|nr:isopentenyl-diphosphate Delta-isomerase [Nakamurella endophytica]GGM12139.1 isopentenyl-diphosphate Delta-isomerase [Nakamurella endophytica]
MTVTDDLVVLVDPAGRPIGQHDRSTVHGPETPLHLAFSLYLFDEAGSLLMTRRALDKRTWPGVWTNSCCGHPRPGEPVEEAVRRRLDDELGVEVAGLRCVLPTFSYRARDAGGTWENELCPVFVGRAVHPDGAVRPNPSETMETNWVGWDAVRTAVAAAPWAFSPWSVRQIAELGQDALAEASGRG